MSAGEKAKAMTERAIGKVKETIGRTTGDERTAGEGKAQKTKGRARHTKEKGKDTFKG